MIYRHLLPSGLLTDSSDVIIRPTHKSAHWRLLDIQSESRARSRGSHTSENVHAGVLCNLVWGLHTHE